MNVYVETNFVLELALKRDQWLGCQAILKFNQTGKCSVYIPAFALVEPYGAIVSMRKSRRRLSDELSAQLRELARRAPNHHLPESSKSLSDAFALATDQEDEGLAQVATQLLTESTVLPLDGVTIALGRNYIETYGLEIPDAIMLASAIVHARQSKETGLFLNRNHKDFDVPEIKGLLSANNCRFCRNFAEGAQIIRNNQN